MPPVVPPTGPPPMPYGRVFITDPTGPRSEKSTCFSNPWTWSEKKQDRKKKKNFTDGSEVIKFVFSHFLKETVDAHEKPTVFSGNSPKLCDSFK